MPAEVITSVRCMDYESVFVVVGSTGTQYEVTCEGLMLHCTCPAFRYFKGPENDRECKHTKFVWRNGCFWNTQWYEGGTKQIRPMRLNGREVPDEKCPHCGGPVVAVRIAV